MAGVGALISSLLSSAAKLLPEIKNSFFAPSSSSSAQSPDARIVEDELNKLMRTLKRIKSTLYDAEEREIRDRSVKLWLKELKEVAYEAEYVIDEYMYEIYRAQAEARNASELKSHNMMQEEGSAIASCAHSIRIPDGFVDHIREIRGNFDEITVDRQALRLYQDDGWRRDEGVRFRAPSSHLILEPNVFGREKDQEKVTDLLFSNMNEGIITVIAIAGKGGLGKTTLAQLVYNDKQVNQQFDLFGWICVSEDFNIERLMQELIESLTHNSCSLKNLSTLQEKLKEIVVQKKVLVVLDDVWNEDKKLWELIRSPFMSALRATFIVTTRNDRVAKIMQASSPFRLRCLSEEESWSIFQHYAFGGSDHNVHPNLLNIGRQISKKCGGLPLAVKSISNLLRYENEESWIDILQNDSWEDNFQNEIFGALQISYTCMPACLRQCFMYCSLFPKNYEYDMDELIELWISQGYIESKGKRNLEEIAFEYVIELRERSFLESFKYVRKSKESPFLDPFTGYSMDYELKEAFKMHDMIHDLARINSEKEFYYIEITQKTNLPDEVQHVYHLYNSCETWNHLNLNNITRLRTLISKPDLGSNNIDLSEAKRLRALKMQEYTFCPNFVLPKHLRFLELHGIIAGSITAQLSSLYHLERLKLNRLDNLIKLEALRDLVNLQSLSLSFCKIVPESLGLLFNLRTLCIKDCTTDGSLDIIGNLIQLHYLVIHGFKGFLSPESLCKLSRLKTLSLTKCPKIVKLPNDIGNLINLQILIIWGTGIDYLPPSFTKLSILSKLNVQITLRLDGVSDTIGSLKDFDDFKGTLVIENLRSMSSLDDACKFNLVSKPYMEKLILSWDDALCLWDEKHIVRIGIETSEDYMKITESTRDLFLFDKMRSTRDLFGYDIDLRISENLQPHPNLKNLQISYYNSCTFPRWMGDPLCCASLEVLGVTDCSQISYLPFSNFGSLKHLNIYGCGNLQTISRESLPSQLQSLIILFCWSLHTIMGLEDLDSLVELKINLCKRLASFPFELISEDRCHKSSLSGLKNLSPLKKLKISKCPELRLAVNEVVPSWHCNIEIYECEGLKEWCLQHNIDYRNYSYHSDQLPPLYYKDYDSFEVYSSSGDLGQPILKHMEKGNSSADVIVED